MRFVVPAVLVLLGLIHLLPLTGALGGARLQQLYGVDPADANLQILLRHRAVLLALVGAMCFAGAWRPALQVPALAMAAASVVSFLWMAYGVGGFNERIARVAAVDVAALVLLAVAAGLLAWPRRM